MQQFGPILITALVVIVLGLVCFQNKEATSIAFFGSKSSMPISIVMVSTFFLGLIPGFGFMAFRKKKQVVSKTKEIEWDKQDEKLAKELGSDHVKQLEAKIETLETALKAALTKKKS